jgi:ATP-binding protein involved in chromosome partitioning
MIAEQSIREALRAVIDPEIRRSVVELEMVRGVDVRGDHVDVTIALTVAGCPMKADLEGQVRHHVGSVEGVATVGVAFDVMSPQEKTALRQRLQPGGNGSEQKSISLSQRTRVVALASGKGGVGKSTLSVNLAAALAAGGSEVGIVDADIHGYSVPRMLGVSRRPVVVDKMIVPPVQHGLRVMSIGFFLDSEQAVVWRGPMLHRALEQFLTDVHWGELDTLVVDMPPGTGDVSISLGQLLPRAEAVIVTTPQPLAQEVAARAALMAQKTNMRLLGVVENMTGEAFGSGGGERLAHELGVELLGTVPLDPRLREAGDAGEPLVETDPGSESAQAILGIAEAIAATRREQGVGIVKSLPLVS